MSFQPGIDNPPQFLLQLEILTEHADEADLALMSAAGREIIDDLQIAGYTVQPVSTGQRGGDVLVNVVTTLTTIATNAWANKESIERVVTDASGLVTVCGGIASVGKMLLQVFKKRATTTGNTQEPVKISVEIDGAPMTVEAADLEQGEAALKLALQFYASHPTIATHVTTHSKAKLRASLPKAPRRKRR